MSTISGFEDGNETNKHYSEKSLFERIKKFAKKAGIRAIYAVLLLYYVLQKDDVPVWAKGIIISSLGYFILPIDIIPDITPVGYSDDLVILFSALASVAIYIDGEIKTKARNKLKDWFGDYDESCLNEVDRKI